MYHTVVQTVRLLSIYSVRKRPNAHGSGVLRKKKSNPGEQKSEGSNNYTSSSTTIIMHKPNQWSLRLRGAAMLLMNSSNEQ